MLQKIQLSVPFWLRILHKVKKNEHTEDKIIKCKMIHTLILRGTVMVDLLNNSITNRTLLSSRG